MTFYGVYLRRSTAEARQRAYMRRGLDPTLTRRLGVWVLRVTL